MTPLDGAAQPCCVSARRPEQELLKLDTQSADRFRQPDVVPAILRSHL